MYLHVLSVFNKLVTLVNLVDKTTHDWYQFALCFSLKLKWTAHNRPEIFNQEYIYWKMQNFEVIDTISLLKIMNTVYNRNLKRVNTAIFV